MNKIVLAVAALVAATACGAAARSEQASPLASTAAAAAYSVEATPAEAPVQVTVAPIECAIRTVRTADGVRFDAIADGFAPISGQYEFVLTKTDAAGSSDIVQGGDFSLAPGQREMLGSAELSLDRGARYRARLVLSDAEGELCRSVRRS
ncbi:MAG: hypothetical protein K2P58_10890 [Hyphomonadaceae bacterium]|nr:hypothetical protein [Hyphomonadaceae bacterium]